MKRTILSICLCMLAFFGWAQDGHLKFAGVALDGTISQFQSKLLSKGYTLDSKLSAQIAAGCRAFNGTFAGNKVEVFVYYDENNKIVYRAKAVISGVSEDIAEQKYTNIKSLLKQKYDDCYYIDGEQSDKESYSILPKRKYYPSDDETRWQNSYGSIDLFITKDESYARYPYWYNLHIDYTDQINSDKHNNSVLDCNPIHVRNVVKLSIMPKA